MHLIQFNPTGCCHAHIFINGKQKHIDVMTDYLSYILGNFILLSGKFFHWNYSYFYAISLTVFFDFQDEYY